VLVNNAGIEKNAPFVEVTHESYVKVMAVNVEAPFFATQAFVRHLKQAGRPGKVINVSSIHEDLPFPNFAPYCLSKGALRMMTRTLAVELRGSGSPSTRSRPGRSRRRSTSRCSRTTRSSGRWWIRSRSRGWAPRVTSAG
jgi:glucose 1-dehydrogenase